MAHDKTSVLQENHENDVAWAHWFRAMYPKVYYTMFSMTSGNRALSEDLAQESITRFIRYDALNKVSNDADSAAYLIQTARRMLADEWRKESESVPYSENIGDDTAQTKSSEREESLDDLAGLLEEPERLLLSWLREGRSLREVASRLSVTYSAAGVRVHRLREKLKKLASEM